MQSKWQRLPEMGGGEEEKSKVRNRSGSESLGWLTESAVLPKKHKAIEGVGPSSIVDLKAQLYRTQQQNLKHRSESDSAEYLRAKKRIQTPADVFSSKNSGVDARANKDKLELKAVKDGSASYAALEKKAELYEKLARGELPDEEDKEKYCVDFFQKSFTQDEPRELGDRDICDSTPQENGEVKRLTEEEMEFDMIGINVSLANAFWRILIAEVPSMAIEKVGNRLLMKIPREGFGCQSQREERGLRRDVSCLVHLRWRQHAPFERRATEVARKAARRRAVEESGRWAMAYDGKASGGGSWSGAAAPR